MSDWIPYKPQAPLALGSFLVVALVAVVLFVPTFSAHVAVLNTVSIDATPTEYALSEEGETLIVQIAIDNPTGSEFTASYGLLYGKIDGETVTGSGVEVEETTIPAGEAGTVTARISVEEGRSEEVADAIESGTLHVTGQLRGSMRNEDVQIGVSEETDE